MMLRLNDEHERKKRAQLVAYLLSQRIPQWRISDMLETVYGKGPGESTITKDKEHIERNGWLELKFVSSGIADADLRWILALGRDYSVLSHRLKSESRDVFDRLYVCYSGESPAQQDPQSWAAPIAHFSRSTSHVLERLLTKSKGIIGVPWGRTVAEAIHAMPVWQNKGIDTSKWIIVPTSGEPLGQNIAGYSSTDVADDLAKRLHCSSRSMRGVFATIPEELMASRDALFEFFSRVADFEEILGADGLFRRLDTFITSLGSFDQESKIYAHELMKVGGRTRHALKALAHGDIGGPLIPVDENNPEYKKLSDSWTGIRLTTVARIAKQAESCGAPGVVVLALGSNKAEVLLEAIRRGLVTNAVCDHHLALAVADLLGVAVNLPGQPPK